MRAREFTIDRYQKAVKNLIGNNQRFQEHSLGARRNLIVNSKLRATMQPNNSLYIGTLEKAKFVSFLGLFSKKLYESLRDEELMMLTIEYSGSARKKNTKTWDSLKVGDCFYNIDLKSAYWQIAHKLGYIKTDFYNKYNTDEYKQAKRFCISFLARENKSTYYEDGATREIKCDTTILKNVYRNIRNMLYICIAKGIDACNNEYIDYNIDAISVLHKDLANVKNVFKEMDLNIKITQCLKANEYQYYYGSEIRNFKTYKYEIKQNS